MKKLLIVLLILVVAAAAMAGPKGQRTMGRHGPMMGMALDQELLEHELQKALAGSQGREIGELTVGELHDLLGEVSIAYQKAAFVAKSRAASFMLPGMGQFLNKEPGSGALFLATDLAIGAGTLVGAYFLLPDELQFSSLDYFTTSHVTIKERWENQSFVDLLPSLGVLAGGGVLQMILRGVSGSHAAKLARKNIAEGKITFEPKAFMLHAGPGSFGMGMGWKY